MLTRLRVWLQTHQKQALLGAGGIVAGGLALRARAKAGSADDASGSADVTSANTYSPGVAGLTSGGDSTDASGGTDATDQYLQQIGDLLNQRLPVPTTTPVKAPAPPTPLPKPGEQRHKIVKGDTLAKISTEYYGQSTTQTLRLLHVHNPLLATFPGTARLDTFAGHTMVIPKYTAPAKGSSPSKPTKPTKPVRHKPPRHLMPPA